MSVDEADLVPTTVMLRPVQAITVPFEAATMEAVGTAIGVGFARLDEAVLRLELNVSGPPRAYYERSGPAGTAGYLALPVAEPPGGEVVTLPGGSFLRFDHHGPYRDLARAYGAIGGQLKAKGLMRSEADWAKFMPMFEEYPDDPRTTSEDRLLTRIFLPLR